jgi:riboflavin synthase
MFTGLIREMATVVSFSNNILTLKGSHKPNIGDSIAINGACLTAISIGNGTFAVELSPESAKTLAMENYKGQVHIEPAMMMGDRFEGHIVQGHIDCVGEISSIVNNGNSTDFFCKIPQEFIKYIIPKGSITVDGISLTVNDVDTKKSIFRLTIIPHTIQNTLFESYKVGSRVNIETDMFARYIYNLFGNNEKPLDWNTVDKMMFSY